VKVLMAVLLAMAAISSAIAGEELSPQEIVARAHERAGGASWLNAVSVHLKGSARFYRDGLADQATTADSYEMWRVYPRQTGPAHVANGKFRLDSRIGDRIMFQTSFDGERSYNQKGPLPEDEQRGASESGAFGFGAIRFALEDGYKLERLVDQTIDGHGCHIVRVIDPAGQVTLFGIDKSNFDIRSVLYDTPQGWHQRIYSDFMWSDAPAFREAGRVRFYYDGVLTVDVDWREMAVNEDLLLSLFQIQPSQQSPE